SKIEIIISQLRPASDDAIIIRTSSNSGSSYDSGASDYGWSAVNVNAASGGANGPGDASDSEIQVFNPALEADDGNSSGGRIEILHPGNTSSNTHILFHLNVIQSTNGSMTSISGSGIRLSEGEVNGVQLSFLGGANIAEAKITVYGYR